MQRKRKVLFLGNGINRSFGGVSWEKLLQNISDRSDFDPDNMVAPYPLRAVLVTNDNLDKVLKEKKTEFFGFIGSDEHQRILETLLSYQFDDVVTTNYSYELEMAALRRKRISEGAVKDLMQHTTKAAETQYLLHTYNEVTFEGHKTRIWHIHGESRKPNSIALGHYWYGNILARMKEEFKRRGNQYYEKQRKGAPIAYDSWLDSFILGDVFILGFGFDFSEMDLWWLLNRRQREKAQKGELFFYEPKDKSNREKVELLRLMGCTPVDLGYNRIDLSFRKK